MQDATLRLLQAHSPSFRAVAFIWTPNNNKSIPCSWAFLLDSRKLLWWIDSKVWFIACSYSHISALERQPDLCRRYTALEEACVHRDERIFLSSLSYRKPKLRIPGFRARFYTLSGDALRKTANNAPNLQHIHLDYNKLEDDGDSLRFLIRRCRLLESIWLGQGKPRNRFEPNTAGFFIANLLQECRSLEKLRKLDVSIKSNTSQVSSSAMDHFQNRVTEAVQSYRLRDVNVTIQGKTHFTWIDTS